MIVDHYPFFEFPCDSACMQQNSWCVCRNSIISFMLCIALVPPPRHQHLRYFHYCSGYKCLIVGGISLSYSKFQIGEVELLWLIILQFSLIMLQKLWNLPHAYKNNPLYSSQYIRGYLDLDLYLKFVYSFSWQISFSLIMLQKLWNLPHAYENNPLYSSQYIRGYLDLDLYLKFVYSFSWQISFPEDLNLLELIVITGSVAVIKTFHNSLYLQLCEYLQKSMTVENLNMHLFARYFQCSESELPKKLSLDCPSLRVKRVAQQLYEEGLVVDAGSLLLKLQDFHPTVSTLNGAVTFIRKLFSN